MRRLVDLALLAALLGALAVLAVTHAPAQVATAPAVSFGANVRLTGPFSQIEPAIAANPGNSGNVVGVYFGQLAAGDTFFGCAFNSTSDGGRTWSAPARAPLQRPGDHCEDPAIAADALGNFYYSYIEVNPVSPGEFDVLVARSTDGGKSFPTFSIAVNQPDPFSEPVPDKDFLAVDIGAGSPFEGTIYLGYTDFVPDGDQVEVVVSRDGAASWSPPSIIEAPARNERSSVRRTGVVPVVAPDGSAYLFYARFPTSGHGPLSIVESKSTDGGRTWSAPADVASGLPSPGEFLLKNADPRFGTGNGSGLVANSFPTAAAGADGRLYVAWADFAQGSCKKNNGGRPPCSNADVRLSVSRDGGANWTAPVKVTDETNATDQFFPWIATHPGGLLSLAWRDKRLDPDNIAIDTFYTNTLDGAVFLPNVRVSSVSSPNPPGTFLGDYQGLAATADSVFPIWTDTRFGETDIFTARGDLPR